MVSTKGGSLVKSAQGSGYIGAISRGSNQIGGGMATLRPLVFNPATLCMAAALIGSIAKLDSIHETQKEILGFLEQKEKSDLRGNNNFLIGILSSYKHNWSNEKYKSNNHIKVLDIKQESEKGILFHREQIHGKLEKKSPIHIDALLRDKLGGIQAELKEYRLALHLYAFSSFLEVMLLENFSSSYLASVSSKIREYSLRYLELYTECYNRINYYSNFSIQSHLLNGLASASRAIGDVAAKIPIIGKTQINKDLLEMSIRLEKSRLIKTDETMDILVSGQCNAVYQFLEQLDSIDRIYNQPITLFFDHDHVYLDLPA
jgi:hypothetical protein